MDSKKLERGNDLTKEITVLNRAMEQVSDIDPCNFYFCASEFKDGSGWQINLTGANVAKKALAALISVIEKELSQREQEFEDL